MIIADKLFDYFFRHEADNISDGGVGVC